MSTPPTPRQSAIRIPLAAILAAGILSLFVTAFLWPITESSIKDIPISITGPAEQVAMLSQALTDSTGDMFTISTVDTRDDAIASIRDRTTMGAIVLGTTPEVLEASAAGTGVTQVMAQIASTLQNQVDAAQEKALAAHPDATIPKVTVATTDVVPLASTDARGAGMATLAFPLALGGVIGGSLVSLLVIGAWRRLASVTAFSIVAGIAIAGIAQPWLGVLQGDYLANAAAIALALFATGALVAGLKSMIGNPGVALGALFTILVGNPLSGASQPWQFLPTPWGSIGQWLVPGAAQTLLRNLSYFPDAANGALILALCCWALLGIALSAIAWSVRTIQSTKHRHTGVAAISTQQPEVSESSLLPANVGPESIHNR